ncbi:MAG TPA: 50S ribosomal protein L11 methyltransferase [Desulfonatronum sp.]|nr:50S ribosomal protein L11 methyltransferase [Desulfonatronum sp.]
MRLLRFDCLIANQDDDVFTAFLSEQVSWGWEVESAKADTTRYIVYLDTEQAAKELSGAIKKQWPRAQCTVVPFEGRDWSESWKEFFVPVRIRETFVILPPWRGGHDDVRGLIPIVIQPKMAFGTGHHASTALCLEAVARLWEKSMITPQTRFLDLGTGTGILSLACAKLGLSGLGLDIDPVAVDNALENQRLNDVEGLLEIRRGGLEVLESGQRFGLILANILAGPLARMAADLVSRLEPAGCLVLSGILVDQVARIEKTYQDQALPAPFRLTREEWAALVWTASSL